MKLRPLLSLSLVVTLACAGAAGEDEKDRRGDDTETSDTDPPDDGTDPTGDDTGDDGTEATTGPGVLGDETGLEAMCRRFFECGGSWYEDEEACIQASYDYWGECPAVENALNELGACVAAVDCDEYDPDSYRPDAIGCAEEWQALTEANCR